MQTAPKLPLEDPAEVAEVSAAVTTVLTMSVKFHVEVEEVATLEVSAKAEPFPGLRVGLSMEAHYALDRSQKSPSHSLLPCVTRQRSRCRNRTQVIP